MSGDFGAKTENGENNVHKYDLEKGTELRFEVENDVVTLRMIGGKAELFGTELRLDTKYTFKKGDKVAIFTYHGCKLKLYGTPEVQYVAMETPMTFYSNLANALEGQCVQATKEDKQGPNVLVVGPPDVGKSTLCRILLNYAVRYGRTPLFVDLDLEQCAMSIPGNIGAVVIEKPADAEGNFDLSAPMVFHFGHLSQGANPALFDIIMSSLASVVESKKTFEADVRHSCTIVNTSGWVQGYGYQSLLQVVKHFHIDVVLAIDQERLYSELVRDLKSSPQVKVIFTPKSGGVVTRSREFRSELRDQIIRAYFYGTSSRPFYPYSFDIPFAQLTAYKIGTPNLPNSCLPLGMRSEDNSTKLVSLSPSRSLLNHLLAISFAKTDEDINKALSANIMGFVAITAVDTDRQVVTVLSPQPRPLPKNSILLLSDIQFIDLE